MAKGTVTERYRSRHSETKKEVLPPQGQNALRVLFQGDEWKIVVGILSGMARQSRTRIFGEGAREEERLDEAFKIRVLRGIIQTLYATANMPIPKELLEVLS